MKTFDLKKTGILLVIMLVAGVVLVGPVSAADELSPVYTTYFKLTAGGNNSDHSFFGYAKTLDGQPADNIQLAAVAYDNYGHFMNMVSENTQDLKYALASGYASGAIDHVKSSFDSVSPNDQFYYAVYYPYP
ncbi:hypothetical protein [Methanogenium cariaci]|uniref:hypothetical protein n=1 Tax=Methanogenium cariaci TaxID=2197 RepID=UPI0007802B9E|nr:hypothetical protein [Methanogenium cariaci]